MPYPTHAKAVVGLAGGLLLGLLEGCCGCAAGALLWTPTGVGAPTLAGINLAKCRAFLYSHSRRAFSAFGVMS